NKLIKGLRTTSNNYDLFTKRVTELSKAHFEYYAGVADKIIAGKDIDEVVEPTDSKKETIQLSSTYVVESDGAKITGNTIEVKDGVEETVSLDVGKVASVITEATKVLIQIEAKESTLKEINKHREVA